ncbi:hypothetical protein L1286_01815 [Pseudoalteromonas sp. SMS1]|uniref:hypothetical protein n=1 Tax=Pseudoalteromonas sp. SMS1 TaxID=2908894 RepID=UPI001F250E75|nr:hypothetical protein [Pseudoalteromonas sp. SMS1]MCF2856198.1 hypothetical protein [Pseudoalteromonas sp. SMS1]
MLDTSTTINFSIALMGLTLHILIWEKLPEWGSWFNRLIAHLPKPLAYLYESWHYPYCFGFWAALALHMLTGQYTLNSLQASPIYLGVATQPIALFLDALVSALLIFVGSLLIKALSGPALEGHQKTMAFKQVQRTQNN